MESSMKPSTYARGALIAAVAAAAAVLGAGSATAGPSHSLSGAECFSSTDWQGWKAPSESVLYLRVRMHDIYRVDLSGGSNMLTWPGTHLINEVRGSNRVCSAIDLDLSVGDESGFVTHLIPQSIRKLSAEEVAAIPKKDLP
jgi:hypothetical protein